jgi:hypothetical protein
MSAELAAGAIQLLVCAFSVLGMFLGIFMGGRI